MRLTLVLSKCWSKALYWGQMIAEKHCFFSPKPLGYYFLKVAPGLAIMVIVFGFNLLGDGLRDAFDPRFK